MASISRLIWEGRAFGRTVCSGPSLVLAGGLSGSLVALSPTKWQKSSKAGALQGPAGTLPRNLHSRPSPGWLEGRCCWMDGLREDRSVCLFALCGEVTVPPRPCRAAQSMTTPECAALSSGTPAPACGLLTVRGGNGLQSCPASGRLARTAALPRAAPQAGPPPSGPHGAWQ